MKRIYRPRQERKAWPYLTILAVLIFGCSWGLKQYFETSYVYVASFREPLIDVTVLPPDELPKATPTVASSGAVPKVPAPRAVSESKPVKKVAYEVAEDISSLIRKHFPDDYETAVAVFKAESGLNPNSKGWNCYYGQRSTSCKVEDRGRAWSVDCGIAQINVIGQECPEELFNPDINLSRARDKYVRRGWQPWYAWVNGSHLKYLAEKQP